MHMSRRELKGYILIGNDYADDKEDDELNDDEEDDNKEDDELNDDEEDDDKEDDDKKYDVANDDNEDDNDELDYMDGKLPFIGQGYIGQFFKESKNLV